jgi:DNA-binding MarR family transcriptional regulator
MFTTLLGELMSPQAIDLHQLIPERSSLGFLISDIKRLTGKLFAEYLSDYPLTLAQSRALLCVARFQGIRQVDLAEYMDIQPITLARMIDQLADIGYVERRADPKDRRAFQLFLLPAATPTITFFADKSREFQAQALTGLTEAQIEALFSGLNQVRANLDRMLSPTASITSSTVEPL